VKMMQRTGTHTVFATSCFSRTQLVRGQLRKEPAPQVHAKTMGTTVTLCGKSALSWFKFLDISFITVRSDRCPECIDAVARRFAAGQRS
jgi:hypothetical protein